MKKLELNQEELLLLHIILKNLDVKAFEEEVNALKVKIVAMHHQLEYLSLKTEREE